MRMMPSYRSHRAVTRKLMQQGKTPLGVGRFSLGHSTHCRSGMSGDCCDVDGIFMIVVMFCINMVR